MKRPQKKQVLTALAIILVIFLAFYLLTGGSVSTDDAAIDSNIVSIAPKISGYVKTLNVKDNQLVQKGDVILEIDSIDYQLALGSAQSQLDAASANWNNAKVTVDRYKNLAKGAFSRQQLDNAAVAEKVAHAQEEVAGSQLATAAENLRNTKIMAPFDGRITKRGVEVGAYIQPGQQLLAIVSNDYWVIANFKETQLEKMKTGQAVRIKIDAYPDKTYEGKVDSIQTGTGARFSAFPPENATGNFVKIVQRVPVKILFTERPDKSIPIGPGMSVVPIVDIK